MLVFRDLFKDTHTPTHEKSIKRVNDKNNKNNKYNIYIYKSLSYYFLDFNRRIFTKKGKKAYISIYK